ncbi:medium-chain fatty acid-CoA ligase [Paenibacillus mucilaginosus KNP414]|uniref:Medium-chain fatty acid-CoA ligase n=1 Tax=Paenibacillus mucilaginosus (strain KNP414) TaxID=1036673 RepID=F8F5B9_PAEMK|nr:medium-chain fatty acid-CoA ligase [Paenibacillus mucilaginosus KNP414]
MFAQKEIVSRTAARVLRYTAAAREGEGPAVHVEGYIVMSDGEDLPETSLQPHYSYENMIESGDAGCEFPSDINESAPAGMCYTYLGGLSRRSA